jgi:Phosphotransferase enzyme family
MDSRASPSEIEAGRRVLAHAAAALDLEIVTYCNDLNIKGSSPRYLHANVREPSAPSLIFRLKVVNPRHPDCARISDCCRYGNRVHRVLVSSESLQAIVDVPAYRAIPLEREESTSCSGLVGGRTPTTDDLPRIVDALVQLTLCCSTLTRELSGPGPLALNCYSYEHYRSRLRFSLRSLLEVQAIPVRLADKVLGAFDEDLGHGWPHRRQTFVHGDFSFGNLRLRGGNVVLLDFEHSHIGFGEIDLAHLYVNLAARQNARHADGLLHLFQEQCERKGVEFASDTFRAAVLERVAGKLNSMSGARGDEWETLNTMLESYAEHTG